MNLDKFERFILKRTNNVSPPHWELLDKTSSKVIEHYVEGKNQGPSKEWGPFGWYCHPMEEQIQEACGGKSIELPV